MSGCCCSRCIRDRACNPNSRTSGWNTPRVTKCGGQKDRVKLIHHPISYLQLSDGEPHRDCRLSDELLGLEKLTQREAVIKNRRPYRQLQDIDKLPKRDQEALLRTIDALLAKAS